jgi:hypothetical protein
VSARRTFVLAALFGILGGWVLFVEGLRMEPAAPEWERAEKIVDCARAPISAIEIAGRIVGKKSGERWTADVPAERRDRIALAFEDLSRSLCELPILDRIAEPGNLADYGLEPPARELRLEQGERKRSLDLGAATPAQNLLYARFRDEPAVLQVGVLLRHEVEKVLAAVGG